MTVPGPGHEADPVAAAARGRDAARRHAWAEAFAELSAADASGALAGADLEALADAAFFAARPEVMLDAKERAFAAHQVASDRVRAAYVAVDLARIHGHEGRPSLARAWLRRAERILEDLPEAYPHGYLALARSEAASAAGDLDAAEALAASAIEIASRHGNGELHAWGLRELGLVRIAQGRTADGLAMLEEASIAAVSGELTPFASGVICCSMISVCRDLADYPRAIEWIEATDRYCRRESVSGFPGACRIHRAEIATLNGSWQRAEQDLERATRELTEFGLSSLVADGYYATGEVRRLRGDLAGADEALRRSYALGRSPHPALALVRLAEGRTEAAAAAIRAALDESRREDVARARLLPAAIEIELAAGEPGRARQALDDYRALVASYPSAAREAALHIAAGRVLLAESEPAAAADELRAGIRQWREVPGPHEAARGRVVLAAALHALGDPDGAELELRAAVDEFERLGARLDMEAAQRELAARADAAAPPHPERRTFMFTDIVGSTRLAEALGDEAWGRLLAWHDRTLRSLIERAGGRVVNGTGDGFFAAFEDAGAAVASAVAIQRSLAEHRAATGFAPDVRIGLHTADASRRGDDYSGVGVHVAARVGALAGAGQIVATEATLAEAGWSEVADRREVEAKGITGTVAIGSVRWA